MLFIIIQGTIYQGVNTTKKDYGNQLKKAINAGKNRDYKKAIKLLKDLTCKTDKYPQALLYLGRSYHAVKNYNKAIHVLQFFIKLKPDFGPGHFFLGRSYLAIEFYGKAIKHLKQAAKDNPSFAPTYSLLGLAYLKVKKAEIALKYLEKAMNLDPENQIIVTGYFNALLVQAIRLFYKKDFIMSAQILQFLIKKREDNLLPHLYLATIFKEMGKYDLALIHYTKASEITPQDPALYLHKAFILLILGRDQVAIKEIKKAAVFLKGEFTFTSDPQTLLKHIAINHFKHKRYREAIYFARKVLKNNYKDTDMHVLIAESYKIFGDLEKAKNHYNRALEIDQKNLEHHYALALILWEQEAFAELLKQVNRIKRINIKDRIAQYFYALCLSKTGADIKQAIQAIQSQLRIFGPDLNLMCALAKEYLRGSLPGLAEGWLKRVLKIESNNKEALAMLAEAYEDLGRKEKEINTIKQYLTLFTNDVGYRKKYIYLLIDLKHFKEASKELAVLVPYNPRNIKLKQLLSYCHKKAGNYAEAALIFQELLKAEPKSVYNLRSLVFCLDKLGNRVYAINLLNKAVKFFKNNKEILIPLGVLYSKEGNYEEAGNIFRKIISLSPKDWRAYYNLAMVYKRTDNQEFADKFLKKAEEFKNKG